MANDPAPKPARPVTLQCIICGRRFTAKTTAEVSDELNDHINLEHP